MTVSQPAGVHHLPSAASAALTTSDTIKRNAMPSTMPKERRRVRSRFQMPLDFTRAGARQMRSSASCSSLNTVVAPRSRTAMPTTVETTPAPGRFAA